MSSIADVSFDLEISFTTRPHFLYSPVQLVSPASYSPSRHVTIPCSVLPLFALFPLASRYRCCLLQINTPFSESRLLRPGVCMSGRLDGWTTHTRRFVLHYHQRQPRHAFRVCRGVYCQTQLRGAPVIRRLPRVIPVFQHFGHLTPQSGCDRANCALTDAQRPATVGPLDSQSTRATFF